MKPSRGILRLIILTLPVTYPFFPKIPTALVISLHFLDILSTLQFFQTRLINNFFRGLESSNPLTS